MLCGWEIKAYLQVKLYVAISERFKMDWYLIALYKRPGLLFSLLFGATVCKTVRPMLSVRCLSCLSCL